MQRRKAGRGVLVRRARLRAAAMCRTARMWHWPELRPVRFCSSVERIPLLPEAHRGVSRAFLQFKLGASRSAS